ncbi:hypothetical protein TUM17377_07900 [Shewanella chilikensis]|nr:hypothetical protein TUM17377_07900 [Shewanella chilikensis]
MYDGNTVANICPKRVSPGSNACMTSASNGATIKPQTINPAHDQPLEKVRITAIPP